MERRQSSFISKLPVVMATIGEKKSELAGKKQEQLPVVMATIGEKKSELAGKKQELLEAKRLEGDSDLTKQLENEWGALESEIDLLEHTANVMRTCLSQRGMVVVAAEEMNLGGVTQQQDMVKV